MHLSEFAHPKICNASDTLLHKLTHRFSISALIISLRKLSHAITLVIISHDVFIRLNNIIQALQCIPILKA